MVRVNKKNIKIAIVMPWHYSERIGGAEVQAFFLAKELSKLGYEVFYICQTKNKARINKSENIDNVIIHWVKKSYSIFGWMSLLGYYNKLVLIKPDYIIHRNTSVKLFATEIYKKIYNKIYNVRSVWICTDNNAPKKTYLYDRLAWRNINNPLKKIIIYLNTIFSEKLKNVSIKNMDICMHQNSTQEKLIIENFNRNSLKMISGHEIPDRTINSNQNFNKRTVIWCGNLSVKKRPEIFIELAKKMNNVNFIMIGGTDDKKYYHELFSNKSKNLEFTGRLSFSNSLKYFDRATVLVNTSYSEGFSNTYIQAWLRGVPTLVLGTDPSGVIEKNKLGFNAPNIDELYERLNFIINNLEQYKILSKNALNYSRKKHTLKVMTENFVENVIYSN